jgi:hypothetical protein
MGLGDKKEDSSISWHTHCTETVGEPGFFLADKIFICDH